jgi:POT family proton-dependent oligopeptide transporter
MKHPLKLYQFSFIEIWNLFTYLGLQAILVLYLTQHLSFSDNHAYTIYGTYTALSYMLPVLGGIIADHYLDKNKTLLFGLLAMLVGNIVLFTTTKHIFFGIALLIMGIGLVKPSNAALVGSLYAENDNAKESGFTLFYVCMNIGAILAPIIYGLVSVYFNWRFGFACSVVVLTASIIVATFAVKPKWHAITIQNLKTVLVLIGFGVLIYLSLKIHFLFIVALVIILICIAIKLFTIFHHINITQKNRLAILLILNVLSISYFAGSVQLGSSLMLFIHRYVNTSIFGFTIPAVSFPALEPIFVILAVPVFNFIWSKFKTQQPLTITITRITLGLFFGSLSFICFAMSTALTKLTGFNYALIMIVVANLFLAAGETCLAPALLSAISYLAPQKYQAMFMGMWYLVMGLAAYLGSLLAKLGLSNTASTSIASYRDNFFAIGGIQIICFIMLLLLMRTLFKLDKKSK